MATVLRMLLAERHLTNHSDFLAAYDRCAAQLDPPVPPGYGPAKTQFYQWFSGRMVGLPRDYHCRVLVRMFPGWTVERLFQTADAATITARVRASGVPAPDIELGEFLGAEVITSGITLVYPTVELPLESAHTFRAAESSHRWGFSRKSRAFAADRHSDVLTALPEPETRGLFDVFTAFQRCTGIPIDIRSDRYVAAHSDRPYLSFGLLGNDCAQRYVEDADRPLFAVNVGAEGSSRSAEVELADGSRYTANGDHDIGVIARVRPSPDLHPDRYWMFCAGLGPRGTAGTSRYLAGSWAPLQQRVGDREFVAVVGVGTGSDDTVHLEYLLTESES
ncbi:hypothetical protein [Nocardia sp. BMG111209]|uniref:hypothetical protein n=1 Tax=Nocardia sp. BMG111209 TaxID=1160137 RepID=UPI0012DC926B|nr:hypothetical protein [Nocardia sp. BMG111209]